jgi:hypothetical protein
VGRSSTAWGNINQPQAAAAASNRSKNNKDKKTSGAYHIPSSWGKGGTAVWENESPFYLYVLKNMALHELALLVSFYNVTVENIDSMIADKEFYYFILTTLHNNQP